jgi:predicted O-linked N-acetylglucosamine transferase (SPINDLY family)
MTSPPPMHRNVYSEWAKAGLARHRLIFSPTVRVISRLLICAWGHTLTRLHLHHGRTDSESDRPPNAQPDSTAQTAKRDHMLRARMADLFLDTDLYGAHSTGTDALWAGLPILV